MPMLSSQTPIDKPATLEDLLQIPEEQRFHEILDGEVLQKAMPSSGHGDSQGRVAILLRHFNRQPNGASRRWRFCTEATVRLAQHQIEQSDVAGWQRQRVPAWPYPYPYPMQVRPDWVCEIMCDGDTRRREGIKKRRIYADSGVSHYWLVDCERRQLLVLRQTTHGYQEVLQAGPTDRVCAEPFDALALQIGILFGDDPD